MNAAFILEQAHRQRLLDPYFAGTITYAGQTAEACIGAFTLQNRVVTGGIASVMAATVQVLKADFPAGSSMKSNQAITVTPKQGTAKACRIESVDDLQFAWQINVIDANQGA